MLDDELGLAIAYGTLGQYIDPYWSCIPHECRATKRDTGLLSLLMRLVQLHSVSAVVQPGGLPHGTNTFAPFNFIPRSATKTFGSLTALDFHDDITRRSRQAAGTTCRFSVA